MKKSFLAAILGVISMTTYASGDAQSISSQIEKFCRVLESEDHESYKVPPTEVECQEIEKNIGPIPQTLREFYIKYGNRVIRGYDMGFLYGGEASSLVTLHKISKEEDWNIPNGFFPFCRDQDYMFCLNKDNNRIQVFERFIGKTNETYESFSAWLTSYFKAL